MSITKTTPPYLHMMNAMELVLIYTPSWHHTETYNNEPLNQLEMGNGFVIHSLRPCFEQYLGNRKRRIEEIRTDEDHDKVFPRKAPTPDIIHDMNTLWPSLKGNNERFQRTQYNKHLKYFHSHALFRDVNMWSVGLDVGKMLLLPNNHRYLNDIIFGTYKIGQVISCQKFVNHLSKHIGRSVKVTFWWPRSTGGPGYLREIIILFNLNRQMLDYHPEEKGYGPGSTFILEGAPMARDWPPAEEEREEERMENLEKKSRRKKHSFLGCVKPFGLISRLCRK